MQEVTKAELKRQNFNVTPEQEADINWLKDALGAPSAKDAIMWAVRVLITLARETKLGRRVYLADESGEKERLLIPELERLSGADWTYLVSRPHAWRRQLYVKGRRLSAHAVWADMLANEMTVDEAAENWDLPAAAVEEITRYCEANKALLSMEADEERRRLESRGVAVGH
jgi:uncharacterized protein (DUF433 family)